MPIYEFYCDQCNTIFNYYSSRINTDKKPECPKCETVLARQISTFATIGRAKELSEDGISDFDESKMERVLGELAMEAEHVDEENPRQMADIMRKFTEKTGMTLGDGMEEALARMEAGEDPEKIEQEMGDLLEGEEPFAVMQKKAGRKRRSAPLKDDTLYEL